MCFFKAYDWFDLLARYIIYSQSFQNEGKCGNTSFANGELSIANWLWCRLCQICWEDCWALTSPSAAEGCGHEVYIWEIDYLERYKYLECSWCYSVYAHTWDNCMQNWSFWNGHITLLVTVVVPSFLFTHLKWEG